MSIDVSLKDPSGHMAGQVAGQMAISPAEKLAVAPVRSTEASPAVTEMVTPMQVAAAVEQLRSHLGAKHGNAEFTVDYLSGLDVVTVRAPNSGDVIFQVPSTVAVNLARLIKEGASLSSLGLLDAKV